MIEYAYVDLDIIGYKSALSCEKSNYKWVCKSPDGDILVESEVFESAKKAKLFYEELELMGDTEGWERITLKVVGLEEDALSSVDKMLKDYLDTAIRLSKNPKIKLKGFLTKSGSKKTKDRPLLEFQYQHNRAGLTKPVHLNACRDYLLTLDWVIMSPPHFEADAVIIYNTERRGEKAMLMSCDKDLSQVEDAYYVNMNDPSPKRKLMFATGVGKLYYSKNSKGTVKISGDGFKWTVFQALVGDSADGYYGFYGFGQVAGYELLKDCETKQSIMDTVYEFYKRKLTKGLLSPFTTAKLKKDSLTVLNKELTENYEAEEGIYQYISWDGVHMKLNARELLDQHLNLSWQERGAKRLLFPLGDFIK